jgi:hypothetical protein
MKLVATTIVALFAAVAFANTTAPAANTTAPAAHEATATTATTKETKTGTTKDVKAAAVKEDCTKMTGEAKAKCETAAKTHK